MSDHARQLSKSSILSRLRERDVTERMQEADVRNYASRKKAASVLVPLILCESGELQVLLTVRAQHLRSDAGDVAFPGGKQDEEDENETATALREAWEEIGLHQTDVEVVLQLAPMISRAGYFITAITGFIPESFTPNINPNEVDDVFRIPLIDFLLHDHHSAYSTPNMGRFAKLHFFRHVIDGKEYVTYGLTAYLCILTACAVYQQAPDFEMEPSFNHLDPAKGLLEHIKTKEKEQAMQSGSKL